MRQSPSIIPGVDHDVYLVEDDFDRKGRCWRETGLEDTDDTITRDLLHGHFKSPVRVVGFNTAEGWSRDVWEDVAHELRQRCADQGQLLPESLEQFVDWHAGRDTPAPATTCM